MMIVFSVSSTVARARMMHAKEPEIANVAARRILASMSQRTYPGNQAEMLSVGHRRALAKLHRLVMMAHEIRLQAATLRFFTCQTKGGMSNSRAMSAKVGKAIEAEVKLSAVGSMVRYADRW